jgi:hypothetical protein
MEANQALAPPLAIGCKDHHFEVFGLFVLPAFQFIDLTIFADHVSFC